MVSQFDDSIETSCGRLDLPIRTTFLNGSRINRGLFLCLEMTAWNERRRVIELGSDWTGSSSSSL